MDELTNSMSPASGGRKHTACLQAFAFLLKTELAEAWEEVCLRVPLTVNSAVSGYSDFLDFFTSVGYECRIAATLAFSAGLGGRAGELWPTLRILLKAEHSVGTSWLQRRKESNLVPLCYTVR